MIDAGISCRETEKRMNKLGLSFSLVKALFISHEHSDHITGISALSKKFQLPVYLTEGTLKNISLPINPELIRIVKAPQTISIGGLNIIAFSKLHDAAEPVSFVVSHQQTHIGIFTDIGHSCKEVIKHFNYCNAVFLESNYCEEMLENGSYPLHLKQRIRGKKGHLSNNQALDVFINHRGKQLSHLILSHLSQNNNTMEKVRQVFAAHAGNTEISIASRYKETPVYEINTHSPLPGKIPATSSVPKKANQLSLF